MGKQPGRGRNQRFWFGLGFFFQISTMYYVTTLSCTLVICHADLSYVMHKSPDLFSIGTFPSSPLHSLQTAPFRPWGSFCPGQICSGTLPLTSINRELPTAKAWDECCCPHESSAGMMGDEGSGRCQRGLGEWWEHFFFFFGELEI